jgi:hypothetical protein
MSWVPRLGGMESDFKESPSQSIHLGHLLSTTAYMEEHDPNVPVHDWHECVDLLNWLCVLNSVVNICRCTTEGARLIYGSIHCTHNVRYVHNGWVWIRGLPTWLLGICNCATKFTSSDVFLRHPFLDDRLQLSAQICDVKWLFVDDCGLHVDGWRAIPSEAVWTA